MRGASLSPVLARVERLVSAWPSSEDEGPVIIHWQDFCQRCPSCDADLAADAAARAVTAANAARARGDAAQVFYWADNLPACPQCGAALPA